MTAPAVAAAVRELAPEIRARAAEAEAARTTPRDLVDKLRAAGVFRMLTPKSHGGLELPPPEAFQAIVEAARADGSIGWTAMIGSATGLLLSRLPRASFDRIFAAGPDQIQAGLASMPGGKAEVVEGGYRVTGRWPFASGCQHADWIIGMALVTKDGEPQPGPMEGMPATRIMVLPANDWTIEDSWKVAGLRGTGSNHTTLADAFVPEDQTLDLMASPSCLDGPMYGAVMPWLGLMHSAFAVGMAQGAVEELVQAAGGGRQQVFAKTPLRESPVFHYELGQLEAKLQAATAMYETAVARQWARALAGQLTEPGVIAECLQTAVWTTGASVEITEACFNLAGGPALYDASPLQRRMRDMQVARQHAAAHPKNYELLGAARMGIKGGLLG
jgi:alkylation response protein AidB-like acyl-CoA dehydrogenase